MPAASLQKHFVISSHADARQVLDYAHGSGAKRITLLGPAAEGLASHLRDEGHKAWPLPIPHQLQLALRSASD